MTASNRSISGLELTAFYISSFPPRSFHSFSTNLHIFLRAGWCWRSIDSTEAVGGKYSWYYTMNVGGGGD